MTILSGLPSKPRWAPCFYCGLRLSKSKRPTWDHRVPRDKGGLHLLANLEMACPKCNGAKANRTVEEYRMLLMQRYSSPRLRITALRFWGECNNREYAVMLGPWFTRTITYDKLVEYVDCTGELSSYPATVTREVRCRKDEVLATR